MQKITKIGVTDKADEALDRMLKAVTEGYTTGKVTKNDLASWILVQFEFRSFQSQIEKIRKDHFDKVQYLLSMIEELKRARQKGEKELSLEDIMGPVEGQINLSSVQNKRRSRETSESGATKAPGVEKLGGLA